MSSQALSLAGYYTFLLSGLLGWLAAGTDPVLKGRPFASVWNAPTSPCLDRFGVTLDLSAFDIVLNQNHTFQGSEVVIFYSSQLGFYPYYDESLSPVNGGLPQNNSLRDHLDKAFMDLLETISHPGFNGVAVVDWESWRPLWARNWDKMRVYQQSSQDLVKEFYPHLPPDKVIELAKAEFETAARKLMQSTLELGRALRPKGLWGFYGFPSCYNYGYKKKNYGQNYTGECPIEEIHRNDNLTWLWEASQALYPDIYLEQALKMSEHVGPYVKHRVLEGIRVAKDLPVLPYARIVYTYSMDFLTQEDLIQTIGQSAALGAAGIILWGNADYSRSEESCLAVKSYIDETLGRYLVNVSSSAMLCSKAVCTGNGRCVRKDPSSDSHLHLHPDSFRIKRHPEGRGFVVSGQASKWDILYFGEHFYCRCYPGWDGEDCTRRRIL
ncbi:hypothetical protein XENTR_v10012627 [Xenopus tropicalis]|uniref:Hyaluronidase n=1 Tax=Xenopus tropicalis TaxID=8364 RepID=A0A6I8SP25_XENTR|nr:hyaluronidase-1 [Xenopus tropicalis]KAE8611870.1 hypothetical protein XENTR_v10012627 [Xenopus tropicalis]|eukprot:XP_002935681.1 PREDICTED: hyaluronidase-1 [Xenopus tropicalis]